ncbi:hypothetical protein ACHAXA_008821 [Cyclostephanos tholiformis]|uniref:RecQ-mediated genome instability protein 1 n=1 Tax=Cyclostephanos tholiformis TaxID=382380 RepID=A0ABD3RBR1_9STRA
MTMNVGINDNGDDAAVSVSMDSIRGQSGSRRSQDENALSSSSFHQEQQRQQQHQRLQQRFEEQAGIRPSHCWLEQCLVHLRNSVNASRVGVGQEEGEIWNQILHADLRDVVREYEAPCCTIDGRSNDNAEQGGAAKQLRNAVIQSKNGCKYFPQRNEKYQSAKIILPSDFRLLIQMEEIIDVAMNGEGQVAAMGGGPSSAASAVAASNNSNNRINDNIKSGQQQNQSGGTTHHPRHRCLKMTFSDGYYPNGNFLPQQGNDGNGNNSCHVLLAMETSPILKLSVSSQPGLKLLLHGPIVIRVGLVELNGGNCAVMGGEVDSWREVWKKAKERVQREQGLGIDPTVKALVWNPLSGNEEELDEGEGESGEATAIEPPLPPPSVLLSSRTLPLIQPVITPNQPTMTHSNAIQSSSQNRDPHQTFPNAISFGTHVNASRAFENGVVGNSRQRTLDFYPKKPRPETTRLMPSYKNVTSATVGALYEQYYDRIITVPCKMEDSGSKDKVFNIVKAPPAAVDDSGSGKKKSKLKKEKKYEFFFVGKFFGPKLSDGAIACRVESSLLAPYFDIYSPAEIRKLTREDKDRVHRIINQCMSQCIHDFSSLGQFQMKLIFTPDEFTAEISSLPSDDWLADTAHPYVVIVGREGTRLRYHV